MADGPKLVIVDIDHTLVDGNTNLLLAKRFVRGWQAIKIIPKLIRLALSAPRNPKVAEEMMALGGTLVLGRDADESRRMMEQCFERDVRGRIFTDMEGRIAEHRRQGARVWLAGPVAQQMADRLAREVSAERAYGADVEVDTQGRLTDRVKQPLPYRKKKRDLLLAEAEKEGIAPGEIRFYSDAYSDLPLLEAVGEPYVINAQKELAPVAQGRGWPSERFTRTRG